MLGVSMRDPVRTIVSGAPATIAPVATLRAAAEELTADLGGILGVEYPRGVLGVVSERDIVRALAEGGSPDGDRVRDVMTDDVATVDVDATIADAAAAMMAAEIRHLAVTDGRDLVGVISVRDVVAVVLEESGRDATTV
jgi:CBS domain-containing protein